MRVRARISWRGAAAALALLTSCGTLVDGGYALTARDAGSADTGSADTGSADTGTTDTGATDTGTADTGATEGGMRDVGSADAALLDASAVDAGAPDAPAGDAAAVDGADHAEAGVDAEPADSGQPASPTDPYFSSVLVLLHFEDPSIRDVCGHTATPTGQAAVSTAQHAAGGGCLEILGSGGATVSSPNGDLALPGAFTVELSYRVPATGATRGVVGFGASAACSDSLALTRTADGRWSLSLAGNVVLEVTSPLFPLAWHHVALTRDGAGIVRLFVDGDLLATGSAAGTVGGAGRALLLGDQGSCSPNGYFAAGDAELDEVRVTRGVARYTSAFAPPAGPFPDR